MNWYLLLIAFLVGMILGIVLWENISTNTVFKGRVKIKQRGKGNVQKPDISAEIKPLLKRRRKRKAKRLAKKLDKL